MATKSLADVLEGIDPKSVTIDANGRLTSSDPSVAARLDEVLGFRRQTLTEGDPNGVQCHCGSTPPP